jgi:hypothetical protein
MGGNQLVGELVSLQLHTKLGPLVLYKEGIRVRSLQALFHSRFYGDRGDMDFSSVELERFLPSSYTTIPAPESKTASSSFPGFQGCVVINFSLIGFSPGNLQSILQSAVERTKASTPSPVIGPWLVLQIGHQSMCLGREANSP